MQQFPGEQLKSETLQKFQDATGIGLRKQPPEAGIGDVEGDADGHGLAVTQPVFGQLLQLVRGPVAEVERPRGAAGRPAG